MKAQIIQNYEATVDKKIRDIVGEKALDDMLKSCWHLSDIEHWSKKDVAILLRNQQCFERIDIVVISRMKRVLQNMVAPYLVQVGSLMNCTDLVYYWRNRGPSKLVMESEEVTSSTWKNETSLDLLILQHNTTVIEDLVYNASHKKVCDLRNTPCLNSDIKQMVDDIVADTGVTDGSPWVLVSENSLCRFGLNIYLDETDEPERDVTFDMKYVGTLRGTNIKVYKYKFPMSAILVGVNSVSFPGYVVMPYLLTGPRRLGQYTVRGEIELPIQNSLPICEIPSIQSLIHEDPTVNCMRVGRKLLREGSKLYGTLWLEPPISCK